MRRISIGKVKKNIYTAGITYLFGLGQAISASFIALKCFDNTAVIGLVLYLVYFGVSKNSQQKC